MTIPPLMPPQFFDEKKTFPCVVVVREKKNR